LETQILTSFKNRLRKEISNPSVRFSVSNLVNKLQSMKSLTFDTKFMIPIKESVEFIMKVIPKAEAKSEYFPIQTEMCKIVQHKKDYHRIGHLSNANAIEQHQSIKMKELKESENKAKSSQTSHVFEVFLELFNKYSSKGLQVISFITEFHHELACENRRVLTPLRKKILLLESEFNQNPQGKTDTELAKILKELEVSRNHLTQLHWGFEDFMREVAFLNDFDMLPRFNKQCINIAVEMLLNGLPLEFLDGFSFKVALNWWKKIFWGIDKKLNEKCKVCVVSVLGVQSSGKSTMLNTMFGLNFNVSVGRCTRGIYMQLLSLDSELRKQLKCTHLMLLDTEGLCSPEMTEGRTTHDNELATFAMAVSNLTIINVRGENLQEFSDILQIVCIAMVRMQQLKLKPACVLVHQGMDAVEAGDKLAEGRSTTRQLLDQVAHNAANVEHYRANKTTRFQDIIEFDITNRDHVWYIPSLWKGEVPMASINPAYTRKLGELRESIFDRLSKNKDCFKTFDQIQIRLSDTYEAILKENFVFSFKNNMEIMAYRYLEKEFSNLDWEIKNTRSVKQLEYEARVHNTEDRLLTTELENCLVREFEGDMEKAFSTSKENLSKIFNKDEHKEYLVDHSNRFNQKLKDLYEWNVADGGKCIRERFLAKLVGLSFMQKSAENEKIIIEQVKQYFEENKGSSLNETQIDGKFGTLWNKWIEELRRKDGERKSKDILFFETKFDEALKQRYGMGNVITNKYFHEIQKNNRIEENLEYFLDEKKGFISTFVTSIKSIFNSNSIKDLRIFLTDLNMKIPAHLEKRLERSIRFVDTDCTDVINLIDEIISKASFSVPQDLTAHIYVFARQKSAPVFKQIEDRFQNEIDPIQQIQRLKGKYLQIFRDAYTKEEAGIKVSRTICNCITEIIGVFIAKDCSRFIVNYLNTCLDSEFPKDRITLICLLLYNLGHWCQQDERVIKYLVGYAQYPALKLKDFLSNLLISICGKHEKQIEDAFLDEINSLLAKCAEAIAKMSISFQQVESWQFMEQVSASLIREVPGLEVANSFKTVIELNKQLGSVYMNANEIREKCKKDIKQIKINFTLHNTFVASAALYAVRELPLVNGCLDTCPFCYTICQYTYTHDCDHAVHQHIIQGISGWRTKETKVFVKEICTTNVASDSKYNRPNLDGDDWHHFKDYKERFPKWHIPADPSFEVGLYWKWVVGRFSKQICTIHEVNESDIPSEWKDIKWEKAVTELEKDSKFSKLSEIKPIDIKFFFEPK
jgi:hypothetical protein